MSEEAAKELYAGPFKRLRAFVAGRAEDEPAVQQDLQALEAYLADEARLERALSGIGEALGEIADLGGKLEAFGSQRRRNHALKEAQNREGVDAYGWLWLDMNHAAIKACHERDFDPSLYDRAELMQAVVLAVAGVCKAKWAEAVKSDNQEGRDG